MAAQKIVTFPSVHHALKAEKLLRGEGIPVAAINTPRHISSDCGICLRFEGDLEPKIKEALKAANVSYQGVYSL